MNKLKNESVFQRFIRRSIAYAFIDKCAMKKNHGNQFTEAGIADIDGHVEGYYVAIEAKMWNNRPTTEQLAFARKVSRTGGIHFFLIYKYNGDKSHSFFWVPGVLGISYRQKRLWAESGIIEVRTDPRDNTSKMIPVMNCEPLIRAIRMK
tara:strand:+ start:306 stop:755 length:450 start_codon:yes stop_codon:yes gene_type:complete